MKIPLSSSKNSFISIESHEKSATKGEKSLAKGKESATKTAWLSGKLNSWRQYNEKKHPFDGFP